MGIKEVIRTAYEKEALKKDRIIAKKEEALLKKDEALLKEKEYIVIRSYKNGISLQLIENITNLSIKEVKAILKKAKLIK